MKHRFAVAALLVAAVLVAAACGNDDDGAVATTSVAIANPASVYCASQGGTVENEETDAGQQGICVLPDGTRVDEWELYRSRGSTTRAIAACTAPETEPTQIILRCADANDMLVELTWTSWTGTEAAGRGTYVSNDCEPTCAEGASHRVDARFTLGGVVDTAKYGRLFSTVQVVAGDKSLEFPLPTSLLSDVTP